MPATDTAKRHRPPYWRHTATELPRSIVEIGRLLTRRSAIQRLGRHRITQSDQLSPQSVMVLPGFSAGDSSTAILRGFLSHWGYDAQPWAQGNNMNPRTIEQFGDVTKALYGYVDKLTERLQALNDRSGQRVSLIGWSLGGIISRILASKNPELVRQVITLGTPFGDPRNTSVYAIFNKLRKHSMNDADVDQWLSLCNAPLGTIPLSILYSASDGLVSSHIAVKEACKQSPLLENIHVESSHLGFTCNPMALYIIADRLAQPEINWQPYRHRQAVHDLLS